jgi:VWFA-related protein
VEQVVVDVVVTDKKGTPIRGLKRKDMTVLEDGTPQALTSFEAIELPDQPSPSRAEQPRLSLNTAPEEQRGRSFAIVFDDTHLTPWRANLAKAAVASFLETGVREGDRVTLVSTAGSIWWTARMNSGRAKLIDLVKRLDGRYIPDTSRERLTESEALRIHVYRDASAVERVLRRWEQYGVQTGQQAQSQDNRVGGTDDPLVSSRASEVYYQAVVRIRTTLDAVERVINGLAAAKGRKSVILVSEGFIQDINLDEFKRINEASRRANAAVYFVNARGLEGLPVEMTAQFGPSLPAQDVGFYFSESIDAVAGAEEVASGSGGFTVRSTNDLSKGIQRIASETQAYYLLGYNPSNSARDGRFRKIQVRLASGKGLQVRARKGYYAPSDGPKTALAAKPGVDPVFQAALDSPWMQDGVPLRMTHYVGAEKMLGKAAVVVVSEVDVRNLGFEEQDGRSLASLQFLLVVSQRETGEYFRYDQTYNLKLLATTRERLQRQWFPIARDFELAAGDYQAKMVIRDTRTGRVGTVIHDFVVPPIEEFRVSTPVLSDQMQPNPSGEGVPGGQLAVIARREFEQGSQLLCRIEVSGGKKDDKSGMPNVTHGYVVRRSDGQVITAVEPSMIQPTSLGLLTRLFGFRLESEPGEYEMRMSVRDELNGRALELREPFTIVPAAALPAPAAAAPAAPGH